MEYIFNKDQATKGRDRVNLKGKLNVYFKSHIKIINTSHYLKTLIFNHVMNTPLITVVVLGNAHKNLRVALIDI